MINIRNLSFKLAEITVFLSVCIATPVSAGPDYEWDSTDLNVSHSKCVERAPVAVRNAINVDKIEKRPNGAKASNKDISIVVHCVAIGDSKSKNIIFVSSCKGGGLHEALSQIQSGMRSGVFE